MRAAAIALAAGLVLGNLLLGWAWLSARDQATAARADLVSMQQQRDGAREAASVCSDAVQDLRDLADRRKSEADAARATAASKAQAHERRADEILATPPAVPGDVCASAQHQVDSWLKGRGKP